MAARRFVLGVCGASGACYALRLLDLLLDPKATGASHEVHLVVSDYGRRLLHDEAGIGELTPEALVPRLVGRPGPRSSPGAARGMKGGRGGRSSGAARRLVVHPNKDVGAVIASGSYLHDGMVVLPCSSASLGQIATGSGSNLLCRAAMVTLKERRRLIVCPREMPLSLVDIRNMEQVALAGATICPPNPGFYLHPERVEDLVDFVVGKVLDLLGVGHGLETRWKGRPPAGNAARPRA